MSRHETAADGRGSGVGPLRRRDPARASRLTAWVAAASLFVCAAAGLHAQGAPPQGRVVVFDEGHAQQFHVRGEGDLDLSRLAGVFERSGGGVVVSRATLDAQTLRQADALVLSGPFHPLQPAEVEAVLAFLRRGGALAVMLHIGPPVADLLQRLGVSISNGVIRDESAAVADNPQDFRVTILGDHPLTAGLQAISFYGVWALLPRSEATVTIASTGPGAWVDLNGNGTLDRQDAQQPFAVIVAGTFGKGRFVVFGDDALFQNRFLTGPNLELAENLAGWLTSTPSLLDSHVAAAPLPGGAGDDATATAILLE